MITIFDIQVTEAQGVAEVSAQISIPEEVPFNPHYLTGESLEQNELRLWYRFDVEPGSEITPLADPFVAALLPVCTWMPGLPLCVEGEVSLFLPQQVSELINVMQWQCPDRFSPEVYFAQSGDESIQRLPQVKSKPKGAFFSGGVDSFYTLLKNYSTMAPRDRIERLIYLESAAVQAPHSTHPVGNELMHRLEKVADHYGCSLINVQTNLSELYSRLGIYSLWNAELPYTPQFATNEVAVAGGIWSTALALQSVLGEVLIPSHYNLSAALRSTNICSPFTDPLWSTPSIKIVHDGCEASRLQKLSRFVAHDHFALQNLSVCWTKSEASITTVNPWKERGEALNPRFNHTGYNCGACEKCLRTMVALNLVGIEACEAFPYLDLQGCLRALGTMGTGLSASQVGFYEEMARTCLLSGRNIQAARTLQHFVEEQTRAGLVQKAVN